MNVTREKSPSVSPVGALLRYWRNARRKSQLSLALDAGVSPRHVCFVETGRSHPSKEMLLVLAETLKIPLREQNSLLRSAGFAPIYTESTPDLNSEHLAPVRTALDAMLAGHEPFPAVVMNRHWDLIKTNNAANRLFGYLLEGMEWTGPANVIKMMFSPYGLRPHVQNWEAVAEMLIQRMHREAVGGVFDTQTEALLQEVLAYPDVPAQWKRPVVQEHMLPILPVVFEKGDKCFKFFSTVTTLGTPQDVLLQEIRIESFYPFDSQTEAHTKSLIDS